MTACETAASLSPLPTAVTLASQTGLRIRTPDLANTNDFDDDISNDFQSFGAFLDGARQIGVGTVYLSAPWDRDSTWRADRLNVVARNVQAARSRGFRVVINVGSWDRNPANNAGRYPYWPKDAANRETLAEYVLEVFRLSGGADVIVSNEPNREAASDEDLRLYCQNVIEIASRKRAAGLPGRLIGFGGTTNDRGETRNGPDGNPMQAIGVNRFFDIAESQGLFEALDAVAVNVYPPNFEFTAGYKPENMLLKRGANEPVLGRVIAKAKSLNLPLMMLETGAPSRFTSETMQQSLVMRALMASQAAGFEQCVIYEYIETRDLSGSSEDEFGIVKRSGEEKPAATTLRTMLAEIGGYSFLDWEYQGGERYQVRFQKDGVIRTVRWSSAQASATADYPYVPRIVTE